MFFKQYSCNPKYESEYLEKEYSGKLELIWCFLEPEKFSFLKEDGIKTCKARRFAYYFYHMTAAVVLYNATIVAEIPHRKGQYRINTWHGGGGGYKKIDNGNSLKFRARLECRETDLFCASSETSLQTTVRIAFQHNGDFLKGTPRNDMLVNNDRQYLREDVHRYLNISMDTKIVLYAPTYREGKDARNYDANRYDYGLVLVTINVYMCVIWPWGFSILNTTRRGPRHEDA